MLDRRNVCRYVAVKKQQVGLFSAFDAADAVKAMHRTRAVSSCDLDGLKRRETGRNEQFDLPLIGKSGDHAWTCVGAFGKQSTLGNKGALEFHLDVKNVARSSRVGEVSRGRLSIRHARSRTTYLGRP